MTTLIDNVEPSGSPWISGVRQSVVSLHYQIANLINSVSASGADDETVEALCKPYFERIERLYLDEMPLARSLEISDIVMQFEGPAVMAAPRASLVSALILDLRNALSELVRVITGMPQSSLAVDIGLSSCVQGSFYIGYVLGNKAITSRQPYLDGFHASPVLAARRAIGAITSVAACLNSTDRHLGQLSEMVPDPRIRDAALVTVKNLCPSPRRGIDFVRLSGRSVFEAGGTVQLGQESREELVKLLAHRSTTKKTATIRGWIREIDLDARRFEVRRIEDAVIQDIRCTFAESQEGTVKHLLDAYVEITGKAETLDGVPRLVQAESVEVLRISPRPKRIEQLSLLFH